MKVVIGKKKVFLILLSSLLSLAWIPSPTSAQSPKRIYSPKKPAAEKQKFVPNQMLVKFKSKPQISYQNEISILIPFTKNKILLRQAGFAVKDMSGVTKLNRKLKVKAIQKLGEKSSIEKLAKVQLPQETSLSQAMADYAKDKDVLWAEPNYIQRIFWTPNDPYFSDNPLNHYQWNLARINMPQAWDFEPQGGSSEIKVAVIDSGVAFEDYHDGQNQFTLAPELSGVSFDRDSARHFNSTESCDSLCLTCDWRDETEVNSHPNDDNGHGTHVTGTIAQVTNNDSHAVGIAFRTTIIPIKVINHCGMGTTEDVIVGINHAVSRGAKVINLSLGESEYSQAMEDAITAANSAGVVVVAATGNEASRTSSPAIIYPAAFPETIAVGATRWDNRRSYYSNYGPEVDLVAPGGQTDTEEGNNPFLDQNGDLLPDGIVQQTILPDNFSAFTAIGEPDESGYRCVLDLIILPAIDFTCGLFEGTSMATPHVSAAAALIFSLNPNLSPVEVKNILTSTASKAPTIPDYNENEYGAGLLDVAAALSKTGSTSTPTPTPTGTLSSTPTPTPTSTGTPTGTGTPPPTGTLTPTSTPTTSPTTTLSPTPSPGYKKGDVNHDGQVNSQDARTVLQYYLQPSWPGIIWPDTNDDGIINGLDFGWVVTDFD